MQIRVRIKKDKDLLAVLETKHITGGTWKQRCQASTASMQGMESPLEAAFNVLKKLATMLQAGEIQHEQLYQLRDALRTQAD